MVEEDEIARLPCGRQLGYAEYGDRTGHPVFYFHGFPACRYEASNLHEAAAGAGVRLISVDRPGYGLSTYYPGNRFTDWPNDVTALATQLGIPHFSILAWSGGGPYALACADALDTRMLTAVGIMACAPPWAAGEALMTRQSDVTRFMSHLPTFVKLAIAGAIALGRLLCGVRPLHKASSEARIRQGNKSNHRKAHSKNPFRRLREQGARGLETFRQGTDATFEEAALLCSNDWGFDFEGITRDKLFFWHGTVDNRAPIGMVRWLVDRIPHAHLQEYLGEGHFDMQKHIGDIFERINPGLDAGIAH